MSCFKYETNFRKLVKKELAGKKFQRTISHNVLQVRSKTATGKLERNSPSRIKAHMMESLVPRSKSDERNSKFRYNRYCTNHVQRII